MFHRPRRANLAANPRPAASIGPAELPVRPPAGLFPQMPPDQFEVLKRDIQANGLRESVWTYQGRLIDGRHRWRACHELGIACPTRQYTGPPAGLVRFVLSLSFARRHLTDAQRAMLAAELAAVRQGERTDLPAAPPANLPEVSQAEAAGLVNLSVRAVAAAAKVSRNGSAELKAKVGAGELSVSAAAKSLREAAAVGPVPERLAGLLAERPLMAAAVQASGAVAGAEHQRMIPGFEGLAAEADRLAGRLNQSKPSHVCDRCGGEGAEAGTTCPACTGLGWGVSVSVGQYEDPMRLPVAAPAD